jgi:hypothetical protein
MFSNPVLLPPEARWPQLRRLPYVPPVLEGRLRPQNVSFAELGERKSFRLLDGYFELLSRESGTEPQVVLVAQICVWISELPPLCRAAPAALGSLGLDTWDRWR